MHLFIILLHVVTLYEIFRITIPDLERLDKTGKTTKHTYTTEVRIGLYK